MIAKINNIKYINYDNRYDLDGKGSYIQLVNISSNSDDIVPVIKYKVLENYDGIIHGFSTRLGGVSKEHLYSMNLSFSRGDEREDVLINHDRFSKAIGYDCNRLVFSDQTHKITIYEVTEKDCGKGITKQSDITEVDGLITNKSNIPLITFYADCVPLFFYDPVNKVVGLAHSGWKGTVGNIANAMVDKFVELYGSNPSDIVAAIGPSICVDCYEVSQDVALQFMAAYSETEIKYILYSKDNGKYQLNLHEACKRNLINSGVLEGNISMPDFCTCCNPDILYSHRASNGMRGNLAAVIMLK